MQKFDRGNIDGQSLRQPVFAIQLENIERENSDGSVAEHQIRQYFPVNFCSLQYMSHNLVICLQTVFLNYNFSLPAIWPQNSKCT